MSLAGLLFCLLTPLVLAGEPEMMPAGEKEQPVVLEEFKIEKGGRPIFVPVRIEGREYLFVLDTGASQPSFDVSFRKLLGRPILGTEFETTGGPLALEYFKPPEAYVGKLDLREGGPVSCTDLEMLRRVLGRDIRGMLGMGFLRKYVVRINFDSGKLQFCSWDGRDHPEWGSAVYLYDLGGKAKDVPHAKGNLAGVGDIRFLVDSGCNGAGGLAAEVFRRATDKGALAEGLTETLAGTRHFRRTRIGNLGIGGFSHRGLVMDEANENLIGLGLLSRYVITFDFPAMKMYLQKGQAFDKSDEIDMSGLHLWRVEARTAVHSVDKDSPVEAAGIKAEDVILKVGEQSATEMDIEGLRDLLKSGDGNKITMTIKRGKEEKVVSFKLKRRS